MALDRTEQTGLGVALAAHLLLFGLLSLSFNHGPEKRFDNPPMAVDIIAEVAPESVSPMPSAPEPAARLGDPDSAEQKLPPPPPPLIKPVSETPPPPRRVEPVPAPRPTPRVVPPPPRQPPRAEPPPRRPVAPRQPPTPRSQPQPAASAPASRTPPRPVRDPRPTGALDGIAGAVAANESRNRVPTPTAPPASRTGTEIRRSIQTSINSEVRGPWNACRVTGIDVDQLKTTIVFRLTESGGLERIVSVATDGITDSNQPQRQRFEECARRAIQLAAPFDLPRENYAYWQTYTLDFVKR